MNFQIVSDMLWAKSTPLFITIDFDHVLFPRFVIMFSDLKINVVRYCQLQIVFILNSLRIYNNISSKSNINVPKTRVYDDIN